VRSLAGAVRRAWARISASFDRLPIRVRLAGVSALLTFVILCAFAIAIGSFTVHRIRADFNRQVSDTADELPTQLNIKVAPTGSHRAVTITPALAAYAAPADHAIVRIYTLGGTVVAQEPAKAPSLGAPSLTAKTVHGYRVTSRAGVVRVAGSDEPIGQVIIQYGRRISDTEATVARVELFLLFGVLAGSGLALLAGMAIARRAMSPIAALTRTAAGIAATRDPSRGVPLPEADDEVAELARTLEGMLRELDAARGETEAMLARQRRFVADASHELRTPLTSVLANLELLAESLHGDEGEAARSALRSSQRMRRLVADLLLLARTDVGRVVPREPCDLAQVAVEAAGELGPVSEQHEIVLDVHPAVVDAARDEQPDRERAAPHAGGHAHPRGNRRERRAGDARGRGRRAGRPAGAGPHAVRALRTRGGRGTEPGRRGRRLVRARPRDRQGRRGVPRRQRHARVAGRRGRALRGAAAGCGQRRRRLRALRQRRRGRSPCRRLRPRRRRAAPSAVA
jgi:signal transduction histidine kinase